MHECKRPLACWRVEAAWALAIRDCKDLAWALTWEWALSIHAAKISTWALTREWTLARDTTVIILLHLHWLLHENKSAVVQFSINNL